MAARLPMRESAAFRLRKRAPKFALAMTAARIIDQLWGVIGNSLDAFTPAECANYFAAARHDT